MSQNRGIRFSDWVVVGGAAVAISFVLVDSCQRQRGTIPETIEVTVPIEAAEPKAKSVLTPTHEKGCN